MASTTFVDGETLIEASWLNDVNAVIYTPGTSTAADIANVPAGNIVATDVQAAINELDTEKQPLDNELTALATSTAAANKIPYYTGTTTAGTLDWNSATALSASTTAIPSQTVVKNYVDTEVAAITGTEIQYVETVLSTVATGTTLVPDDDTIPQNTEGDEYFTCAITPTSATNKLHIKVILQIATNNAAAYLVAGLFQDTTANALAVGYTAATSATATDQIVIEYRMTAGTTSATTFKMRAGGTAAGTVTINGQGGSRKFGGAMVSKIMISEISA